MDLPYSMRVRHPSVIELHFCPRYNYTSYRSRGLRTADVTPRELSEILSEYSEGLKALLGGLLDRVILFGSQARGDASRASDVDVLVVLREPFDYGQLIERTSELTASLALRHNVALSRAFALRDDYETAALPFYMNVRREGVIV